MGIVLHDDGCRHDGRDIFKVNDVPFIDALKFLKRLHYFAHLTDVFVHVKDFPFRCVEDTVAVLLENVHYGIFGDIPVNLVPVHLDRDDMPCHIGIAKGKIFRQRFWNVGFFGMYDIARKIGNGGIVNLGRI